MGLIDLLWHISIKRKCYGLPSTCKIGALLTMATLYIVVLIITLSVKIKSIIASDAEI